VPAAVPKDFTQCSARALPFASQSFQAIVLNHSLEHFENLPQCITEIARVLAPGAFLYIAIPDASTLTDRLYRWLAKGGGHVNLFTDETVVTRMIIEATGLSHAGTRVLYSSLSFMNKANQVTPPRKLLLVGNGNERILRAANWVLRLIDRWFHCRTSVYGWAFYFGESLRPDLTPWTNVCVRCGSGHSSGLLVMSGRVRARRVLPSRYTCPQCGAHNYFTDHKAGLSRES